MSRVVKAGAVQFNIAVGEVEKNLENVEAGVKRLAAQGVRIAVLPEMWSTGYAYRELAKLSLQTPQVLERLKALSAEHGMVIVGSLPERAGDDVSNTAYVVDGGGIVATYRKIHLFSMMGEDRMLKAGDTWVVADTSVGRIGVFICYDLRFPELARRLALEGAQIIVVPAEWPKPREEHWRTLLRARAIENQLFIIAANCCGIQGKLDFFGESMIIGPKGEVLAGAGYEPAEITAELQMAEMEDWRNRITCFQDRKPEAY